MVLDKYTLDVHPDLLESVVDYLNGVNIEKHPIFSFVEDSKQMLSMINEVLFKTNSFSNQYILKKENQKIATEMMDVTHSFAQQLDHPNEIFEYKEYFHKMFG